MIIRTPRRRTTTHTYPHTSQRPPDSEAQGSEAPENEAPDDDAPNNDHCSNSTSDDADSNPLQRDTPATPDVHSEDGEDSTTADPVEPWVEYIQRATRRAEHLMTLHRIDNWTTVHKRNVWRMASRVANHDRTRWTWRVLQWQPDLNPRQNGQRKHGRQHKRWDDEVNIFLRRRKPDLHRPPTHTHSKGEPNDITWMQIAQDTETWTALEHHYTDPAPADAHDRGQ